MSQTNLRSLSMLVNSDLVALTTAKKSEKESYAKRFFMHVRNSLEKIPNKQEAAAVLMQEILSFQRRNQTAFTFTESTFLNLYCIARTSSDPVVQKQVQNKLLTFFLIRSPSSVKRKQFLLHELAQKEDLTSSGKVIATILSNTVEHYIRKGQYKQDPDLSVVHSASALLEKLSTVKSHSVLTNPLRKTLRNVVTNLQTLAPNIILPHSEKWRSKFGAFSIKYYFIKNPRLIELAEAPVAIHLAKQGLPNFKD